MAKVEKTKDCWNWLGELTGSGYGRIQLKGRRTSAHRFFFEFFVKPIPDGLELDHLCRNRRCVNPNHLELVTRSENIRRAWIIRIKNTPNCPQGHPYSGENLYIVFDKKNNKRWRNCKKCKVEANRRWRSKKVK